MKIRLICVFSLLILLLSFIKKNEIRQPNFIVFFIDDMGSADLACYGNTFNQTPNIDQLAQKGVKFTNAYSACTVCSPSRAALMTGKYPAKLHITDWIAGHEKTNPKLLIPDWQKFLPQSEKTVAEYLKENGYVNWHVGKWHLGEGEEFYPLNQGFDINIGGSNWGHPKKGFFAPYQMPLLTEGVKGEYLTDRLTNEAIKLIENHNENVPFFLNLAHYAVHSPVQAKAEKIEKYKKLLVYLDKQKNPAYAAMIESLDEGIGRVMSALEKKNLLENTVIIFASDNGTLMQSASSLPFRKGKGWCYEGGTRTPLIVYWKNKIEGGKVIDEPTITMDLTSTILDLAAIKPSEKLDGKSLKPVILTNKKYERPLFWHYPHYHEGDAPYSAVRLGDWKLIEFFENNSLELYNLKDDISESNNLALINPQKAKELKKLLDKWRKANNAQIPTPNPNYIEKKSK
ncbi:sulfatase [Emticicia aquatilis]|uniref:Sulfatase n=1 Tax=Emticicia aquatilis TaxID=1537369 RepID=A0A917DX15_9BACT|nr:sulfatase [Emticicia aquatilis]GGD76856.1 sulfatase [Emticicia aquatilis]